MTSIEFDVTGLTKKMGELNDKLKKLSLAGLGDVANEILRLSSFEVPHDKGLLQASGNVEMGMDEAIVGYNKVYAARLHEHPEYKFQKGRKGKYLEGPIKNNLAIFLNYYKDKVGEAFGA